MSSYHFYDKQTPRFRPCELWCPTIQPTLWCICVCVCVSDCCIWSRIVVYHWLYNGVAIKTSTKTSVVKICWRIKTASRVGFIFCKTTTSCWTCNDNFKKSHTKKKNERTESERENVCMYFINPAPFSEFQ